MHVHVSGPEGEAKFWLDPTVALADYTGYSARKLKKLQKEVEVHESAFKKKWQEFFGL